MTQTIDELLTKMTEAGGFLLPTKAFSSREIANAEKDGRVAYRDDGLGFVMIPVPFFFERMIDSMDDGILEVEQC